MPTFKFNVKGIEMSTTIICSYDLFSPNITELHHYALKLGGHIENATTAIFHSDEAARKMVDKLYSLANYAENLSPKR